MVHGNALTKDWLKHSRYCYDYFGKSVKRKHLYAQLSKESLQLVAAVMDNMEGDEELNEKIFLPKWYALTRWIGLRDGSISLCFLCFVIICRLSRYIFALG